MSSYHQLIDHCLDVRQFFNQTFLDSGITYFEHTRVYADGKTIYLNTQPEYLQHFYHKRYSRPSYDVYREGGLFLWAGIPELHRYDNQMLDMRVNFNIDHGACFINVADEYIDICDFATHKDGERLINYYIKEQDTLTALVNEYHHQFSAHYLKHLNQPDKIPLRPNKVSPELTYPLSHMKLLTDREMDCLSLLTQGLSAKKIAIQLGISFRTVEQHIGSIKRKASVKTLAELLRELTPYKGYV